MIDKAKIRDELIQLSHEQLLETALKDRIALQTIQEQLYIMNRQKYARKSEAVHPDQLTLFNEIEDIMDHTTEEELLEKPVQVKKKKIRTIKKEEADYSQLPSKTIHHELKDKTCPDCGSLLKETKPTIKYELKFVPASYSIIKHVQHNYVCPNEKKHETMKHIEAPTEGFNRLIEGSVVSPSVVAGIATEKFVQCVPLYRQELELKRKGVPISRQNMSNWTMKCGEEYLEFVFNAMWNDMRELKYLHMDETPLVVLEDRKISERQKSYMWLAMSGKTEENQMALYFYSENRRYENIDEILGMDKQGYVHSDGYKGYRNKSYDNVACMAHVRRKFFEALEVDPAYKKYQTSTKDQKEKILADNKSLENELKVMTMIQTMFEYDKEQKNRKEMKETKMRPLFDTFFACLKELAMEYILSGKMGKAIRYTMDLENELRNYLKDENTELSNNRAERAIKPFVMARKNFLFSNTKRGAKVSAIYFSLIESAKMNGLDPYLYLIHVLTRLSTEGLREDVIREVLPYSNKLPQDIYSKRKDQMN